MASYFSGESLDRQLAREADVAARGAHEDAEGARLLLPSVRADVPDAQVAVSEREGRRLLLTRRERELLEAFQLLRRLARTSRKALNEAEQQM